MEQIFLEFIGPSNNGITVRGATTTRTWARAIEVQSFSLGFSSGTTMGSSTGSTSKAQFSALNIMKSSDIATVALFDAVASGALFPEVRLTVVQQNTVTQDLITLEYTFGDVLVTTVQWSGTEGESSPMESVSLEFAKVLIRYGMQSQANGSSGAMSGGWNITKNVGG